ncbi:SdrD B-like domain-containing protein [Fibrella aquatica]|uniref:SdrD B-like domain-containing protein n=1 Tax=Fibrella aquatica TaxID=3242487 RepID=UPI0035208134
MPIHDNGCGLALLTTVSGCYSVSGVSKATVSAEISWTSIPDGETIRVQLGTQTKTIVIREVSTATEADVRSPQVVAFEVEANSDLLSVSATYGTGETACRISGDLTAPAPCFPLACAGLGGAVFKDFNADGVQQSGETVGLPDVMVRAITRGGDVFTTATDSMGKYTLAVPPVAYPVRVEFTNVPTYAGNGTPNGPDGRTTVQFVNAPDCDVDLGVLNAQEHCQSDPLIIVPCFVNGDPLPTGASSGPMDALVAFPYSLRGNKNASRMMPLALASQVGSLWGTAYNKFSKQLFSSAVMRRHVGLGPGGLGGIYKTDLSTTSPGPANTSLYVNLTDLGINLGAIPSNSDRGLPLQPGMASHDPQAFAAVGKVGMGDMDIAEDGSVLWFTNLADGQLYSLRIPPNGNPGAGDWAAHPLPADAICNSGNRRLWGVKAYQGKVYVGAICDASGSKDKRDLRAIVFAYTPGTGNSLGSGGTFKVVFDFPLTYPKGAPDRTDFSVRGWFPWEDDFTKLTVLGNSFIIHPQPILADIQFDIDGSMVLGFNDRSGLQLGYENFDPNPPSGMLYNNISGGDVLRAYFSNGTYVLENGGVAGPNVGSSRTNNQGPGAGEFYNDDFYFGGALIHSENANGSLAIRPGSGEVVVSAMDPLNDQAWSGGLRFLSNTTGFYTTGDNATSAYVVYRTLEGDGSTFGKATGLGGIGLNCDLPNYLQIGNRVWQDDDRDGEQDPGEKGLAGIRVALYKDGAQIATTTTNAEGEYYFTYTPVSSTVPGSTTALLPNTTYQIMFGANGQFVDNVLTEAGGRYQLTTANATGGTLNDQNDSDADMSTLAGINAPVLNVTTTNLGSVDHSFDAGFFCLPTTVASVLVTAPTCPGNSTVTMNDGRIELSGIQNGDKTFLYTTTMPPAYTSTGNSQPIVDGQVRYTNLPNPVSSAGESYSVIVYNGPCCFTVLSALMPQTRCVPSVELTVTPGACSTLTNEYTITGLLSLTNSINDVAVVTDGAVSTTLLVSAGAGSVPFSLAGLASGSGSHTITVDYAGQSVNQSYTAPLSCTVAATLAVNSTTVCAGELALLTASGCQQGIISWSAGAVPTSGTLVNVSTVGLGSTGNSTVLSYTATCTVGNSVTSAVAEVVINPVPTIGALSTFCSGPGAYTILLTDWAGTTATGSQYELVQGSSFEGGTPVTSGKTPLPVDGVIGSLTQPGTYWIRLYNTTNCFTEKSVEVQACECPLDRCMPLAIKRIR